MITVPSVIHDAGAFLGCVIGVGVGLPWRISRGDLVGVPVVMTPCDFGLRIQLFEGLHFFLNPAQQHASKPWLQIERLAAKRVRPQHTS